MFALLAVLLIASVVFVFYTVWTRPRRLTLKINNFCLILHVAERVQIEFDDSPDYNSISYFQPPPDLSG